MVRVVLNLSNAQLKKVQSGKGIQMSRHQLENGGPHQIEIDVDRKLGNKIHRNSMNGKGFRIPKGLISGVANLAKANSGKLANYAANQGATMLKNQLANSSYVPESMKGELANSLIDMGVNNIKTRGLNQVNSRLSEYQGQGFGSFLKTMKKVGKVVEPIGKTVAKIALPMAGQMAGAYLGGPMGSQIGSQLGQAGANSIGNGIRRKGSAEAKAHMARIRAMKGKGVIDMFKKAGKMAAPLARQAVKAYGADAVALLAQKSGLVDPTMARNMTQGLIKTSGMGIQQRQKPLGRILRNGIDIPVVGSVVHGSSYGGYGYV